VRGRLLDALLRRAFMVEASGRGTLAVQDQLDRLRLYDTTGEHLKQWDAPAQLHVKSEPPGARVVLERYVNDSGQRRIARADELGITPLSPQTLDRGSYRLRFDLPGHTPVLFPILLRRGEKREISVALPPTTTVPDGFVYIPAGQVLYGTDGQEEIRVSFNAEPLHPVDTGPFLISRHEVTYNEYLTYLEALPAEQRQALLKAAASETSDTPHLTELSPGVWQLDLHQGHRWYTTRSGEILTYEGRKHRASVEWEKLPITGITPLEAQEYIGWLARSGRVPGARMCSEHEWEHAARGADNRSFATGDRIDQNSANISTTYDRVASAFGPDPVGSYPQSESPFGLVDTAGNAYELTMSPHNPALMVARGGAFYFDVFASNIANRFEIPANLRHNTVGLRVCATWSPGR
jgi:formylglycine-generating enzyme required for sulfatase activity